MSIEITKDAEKMLVALYKVYLSRRKEGHSKQEASYFSDSFFSTEKPFSQENTNDVSDTRLELGQAGLLRNFIGGDCELTKPAVIYLESRFKNGLADVLSFIAQFIP